VIAPSYPLHALAGWMILLLALFGVGLLLVWFSFSGRRTILTRRFARLVRDDSPDLGAQHDLRSWAQRWARSHLDPDAPDASQREDLRLLACAGWRQREAYVALLGLRVLLPILSSVGAMIHASTQRPDLSGIDLMLRAFIAGTVGLLAPKLLLRLAATARVRRLREEVGVFAEILCVLFDAGLSLEQSLRVLTREGGTILTDLRLELELVLRHIVAGADRAQALALVLDELQIAELSDLVRLLCQIERHGGAAQQPLREFCRLLDDRRRTELQETVSKLSAKMTIVMILFLFPALLVFIGGPGFIALKRALEGAVG